MRDQIYIAPDPLPHFLPTKYFDQKKVFQRVYGNYVSMSSINDRLYFPSKLELKIAFSVET